MPRIFVCRYAARFPYVCPVCSGLIAGRGPQAVRLHIPEEGASLQTPKRSRRRSRSRSDPLKQQRKAEAAEEEEAANQEEAAAALAAPSAEPLVGDTQGIGGVVEMLKNKYACSKGDRYRVVGEATQASPLWILDGEASKGSQKIVPKTHENKGWKWVMRGAREAEASAAAAAPAPPARPWWINGGETEGIGGVVEMLN